LIDKKDGTILRDGKSRADVREALLPIFGRYTVEDAVYAHQMLRGTNVHWSVAEGKGDDPRQHAIYEAREALVHFICHGHSTSPACAAARAAFAEDKDGDGDDLPDDLYDILHFQISHDISDLRSGRFFGERFDGHMWAIHLDQRLFREDSDDDAA